MSSTRRRPAQTHDEPEVLQERPVRVADPRLSADANARLTAEARAVLGRSRVRVPADRPRASQGRVPAAGEGVRAVTAPRVLLAQGAGAGAVLGVVLALLTGSWWLLPVALIVLGAATVLVTGLVLRLTAAHERPSPTLAAQLQEEGIDDPDGLFSEIIAEFTAPVADGGGRTVAVEDDPARAGHEQRSATTPGGGPSRPVGP